GIFLKAHANAVGFLHHVTVGQNVSLSINNYARSQRALADRSIARSTGSTRAYPLARATEEVIEKVVETTAVISVVGTLLPSAAVVRIFDRRFGVDVDHTGLELLGDLRESLRQGVVGWLRRR